MDREELDTFHRLIHVIKDFPQFIYDLSFSGIFTLFIIPSGKFRLWEANGVIRIKIPFICSIFKGNLYPSYSTEIIYIQPSISADMCTKPFYIRDLNIHKFWYLSARGYQGLTVLVLLPSPSYLFSLWI